MRIALSIAFLLCGVSAAGARAQVADSARIGPTAPVDTAPTTRDSLSRPPISPKRALVQSLFLPGWGQASLHRSTAGAIFVSLEVTSIAMLIQAKKELATAKELARDSVLSTDGTGYVANPYAGRVAPRRQAVEDWAALLIFTHLISAADAFVAAQLWDVPVEVHGQATGQRLQVDVRVPF